MSAQFISLELLCHCQIRKKFGNCETLSKIKDLAEVQDQVIPFAFFLVEDKRFLSCILYCCFCVRI